VGRKLYRDPLPTERRLAVRTPLESDLGHFLLYSCRILFAARDYADDGGRHLIAKPLALGFR
jgi:hypothetical protein